MPGAAVPPEWSDAPRIRVDAGWSRGTVDTLHSHWIERRPVVIELALDKTEMKVPEQNSAQPWTLGPGFEFERERLHFLTWANNYDATAGGEPVWWHGRLAQRLGADPEPTDGGPRGTLACDTLHRESIEVGKTGLTLSSVGAGAELAADQLRAVTHPGGPARILAPAGSGKTRVLTQRLQHLLDRGFEPERITALAYNRRAAEEMRARLPGCRANISTLHSLGYALLRKQSNVRLATDNEVRTLLRQCWKADPRVNQDPWQPYMEALQQVRLGLLDPADVEELRDDVPGLAQGYKRYRDALHSRGWVDHDEQIFGAVELLLTNPALRKAAQRACTHLLVDEFQDLTPAFLLLIRLLAAPAYQVFGVGDDDQVIYGYAGADPKFLVGYGRYFPGAASYLLEVNYRCPQGVVAAANQLLGRNEHRVVKNARAHNAGGGPVLCLTPADRWAATTTEQVTDWLKVAEPSQIAVLARVNSLLMPVQLSLRLSGIPCQTVVNDTLLQRTGLRTALAYLRLALDPENVSPDDLADTLRRPNRMLRREVLEQCQRAHRLQDVLRIAGRLDPWPAQQLESYCQDVYRLRKRLASGAAAFFRALRLETGLVESLQQLDQNGLGAAGASHEDDLLALEQAAQLHPEAATFEAWLEAGLQVKAETAGVRLSSVHRVKGLEWDYVVIYGVQQGLMPHRLNPDEEEERRVFHVALTRCRREVALVATPETMSPFVAEMAAPAKAPARKKKQRKT